MNNNQGHDAINVPKEEDRSTVSERSSPKNAFLAGGGLFTVTQACFNPVSFGGPHLLYSAQKAR